MIYDNSLQQNIILIGDCLMKPVLLVASVLAILFSYSCRTSSNSKLQNDSEPSAVQGDILESAIASENLVKLSSGERGIGVYQSNDSGEFCDRSIRFTSPLLRILKYPTGQIHGYRPVGDGPFPLYVYLPGTWQRTTGFIADLHTKQMAKKGYYAVALGYPNHGYPETCSLVKDLKFNRLSTGSKEGFKNKSKCLFEEKLNGSAMNIVCKQNSVDCSQSAEFLVHGYSQGAQLALLAKNHDDRFKKALIMAGGNYNLSVYTGEEGLEKGDYRSCLNIENTAFRPTDIRSIIGVEDNFFGAIDLSKEKPFTEERQGIVAQQVSITGRKCSADERNCLNEDGSGYYIISKDETRVGCAGHSFFKISADPTEPCGENQTIVEPNYGAGLGLPNTQDGRVRPWSLTEGLKW